MNPEMPNFEQPENIEVVQEKQELTPEQKKILGEVWTEMVVDNVDMPKKINEMTQDEIKRWLFESIMEDTEIFAEELGLKIDADLVEKIKKQEI